MDFIDGIITGVVVTGLTIFVGWTLYYFLKGNFEDAVERKATSMYLKWVHERQTAEASDARESKTMGEEE